MLILGLIQISMDDSLQLLQYLPRECGVHKIEWRERERKREKERESDGLIDGWRERERERGGD